MSEKEIFRLLNYLIQELINKTFPRGTYNPELDELSKLIDREMPVSRTCDTCKFEDTHLSELPCFECRCYPSPTKCLWEPKETVSRTLTSNIEGETKTIKGDTVICEWDGNNWILREIIHDSL